MTNAQDIAAIQDELIGCLETEWPEEHELDHEAYLTAQLITYRVKTIADRAELEKAKTPDQPLTLLMGERHFISAHLILQPLLAAEMKARGYNTVFGYETDSNRLSNNFNYWAEEIKECTIQPNKTPVITHALMTQITKAEGILGWSYETYAPLSEKLSAYLLRAHALPFAFNDAPRTTDNDFLEMSDPETYQIAQDVLKPKSFDPQDKIPVESKDGIHIRNHFIAQARAQHRTDIEPDIYIQHYGITHIGGDARRIKKYPYEESALVLATKSNERVLAVPLIDQDFSAPHQALEHPALMGDQYLTARRFNFLDQSTKTSQLEALEPDYLQALMEHLGKAETFNTFLQAEAAATEKMERVFEDTLELALA